MTVCTQMGQQLLEEANFQVDTQTIPQEDLTKLHCRIMM